MRVGEDTLFPKLRKTPKDVIIVAAGTSCRHQIYDGTQQIAKHPVTVLRKLFCSYFKQATDNGHEKIFYEMTLLYADDLLKSTNLV